jgi:hypothetical protein
VAAFVGKPDPSGVQRASECGCRVLLRRANEPCESGVNAVAAAHPCSEAGMRNSSGAPRRGRRRGRDPQASEEGAKGWLRSAAHHRLARCWDLALRGCSVDPQMPTQQTDDYSDDLERVIATLLVEGVEVAQSVLAPVACERRQLPQNFIGCDRDQELLLPPSLKEWLPEEHLAKFVLEAVGELDLDAFYAAYRQDGWGRAAHDPR